MNTLKQRRLFNLFFVIAITLLPLSSPGMQKEEKQNPKKETLYLPVQTKKRVSIELKNIKLIIPGIQEIIFDYLKEIIIHPKSSPLRLYCCECPPSYGGPCNCNKS